MAYDLKAYESVGLNNVDLFRFCRKVKLVPLASFETPALSMICQPSSQVHQLAVDPTEFALLTALVMFTESPLIAMRDQMDNIQSVYMKVLVSYVYSSRSSPGVSLAGLLGLLQDLRDLVEGSAKHSLSDKMKARKLPPLLVELWEVPHLGE